MHKYLTAAALALFTLVSPADAQHCCPPSRLEKIAVSSPGDDSAVQHVVVVMLDDVGRDKVGCYGSANGGPTPVLDAMAANGIRFSRAYANPTCSPTRSCALTGRYGSRTGIDTGVPTYDPATNPNGPFVPSVDEPWLPRLLEQGANTRSYAIGKWHLTTIDEANYHQSPIARGFFRWRGPLSNLGDQSPYSWTKTTATAAAWSDATTTMFVTTDNMIEAWLALQVGVGRKTFVWMALTAPHGPWTNPPPNGTYTPVAGTQTLVVKYQYQLQAVDTMLGQLRSYYAQQFPADAAATMWIVLGDNGTPAEVVEDLPTYSHKSTVYEGGVGVPMIVTGAGVAEPGRISDHLVHAVDLHATILDVLEAPAETETDSISFAGVLGDAEALPARGAVYSRLASPNGHGTLAWTQHCAIGPRWKLIEWNNAMAPTIHLLFDLDADPNEATNLWPGTTVDEIAAVAALQAVIDAGAAP